MMKIKPIINSIVLFTLLISLILLNSGCAKKKKPEEETIERITLSVCTEPDYIPLFHKMLDNFMKEHPQIKVTLDVAGSVYYTKLLTQISGGVAPDVVYIHPDRIIPLVHKNTLLELTPFLEQDKEVKLSNYYSSAVESYIYQGRLYALPTDLSTNVMYYNKNIFDTAKIPYPVDDWKWEDYLKIAKVLTKDFNKDGKINQFGTLGYYVFDAIWQAGGKIVDDYENPKRCLLDSPEAIKGLQFCVDLVREHHVAPNQWEIKDIGALDMFMAGKIAMFPCGVHITPVLRKIKDLKWDVVCLPRNKKRGSGTGGVGLAISAQSTHPQASWKLVKYISGPKGQSFLVKTGWPIPSLKSQKMREMFLSNHPPDNRQAFLDTLNYGYHYPKIPNWLEIQDVIQMEIDIAFLGKKSPSEALRSATARVNELLKRK